MKLALPKNLTKLALSPRSGKQRPLRDWFVLLLSTAILVLASGAWNAWVFYTAASGGTLGEPIALTPAPDTSSLDAVRALFENRAAEEAKYRTEYRFVDPSR